MCSDVLHALVLRCRKLGEGINASNVNMGQYNARSSRDEPADTSEESLAE